MRTVKRNKKCKSELNLRGVMLKLTEEGKSSFVGNRPGILENV